MLKQVIQWPEGSVNDAKPYEGSLKDFIEGEEQWLAQALVDFHLGGFDHDSMLVPGTFPMVAAVQTKYIHGADFFGPGIFVQYGEKPEDEDEGTGWMSHHSGWRLFFERNTPQSVVLLARGGPYSSVEFFVEGEPPEEWVESVIRAYYTARRAVAVAQSRWRATSR